MQIRDAIVTLTRGERLGEDGAEALFESLLVGEPQEGDDARLAALLALLQRGGPTEDELVGAARVMRRHVVPVPAPEDPARPVIDTCGTGGAPKTFNVSTAAAMVIAGARPNSGPVERVRVAKHGNRSRTGRGSAETLRLLGVRVDAGVGTQAACLEEAGVCFCFAIHHHPAAKRAAPVRAALGTPTIFNLLGPLTNPAGAPHQLMGVWDRRFVLPLAGALRRLGAQRAWVVHSDDALDELTVTAGASVGVVDGGAVSEMRVEPGDAGLATHPIERVRAGDPDGAAAMITAVLSGEHGAAREMTVLNAAGGLVVAGACGSLIEGVALAEDSIGTGRARGALEGLVRISGEG